MDGDGVLERPWTRDPSIDEDDPDQLRSTSSSFSIPKRKSQNLPLNVRFFGFFLVFADPHYTELPPLVMPIKPHPNFPGLSTLLSTTTSNESFTHLLESVNATSRSSVVPDRKLTCIDSIYYTTTSSKENLSDLWSKLPSSGGEVGFADGPWLTVGRHLRWTDDLLEKGEWAAKRIWGLEEGEGRPPFISVHIRHGQSSTLSLSCRVQRPALTDLLRLLRRLPQALPRQRPMLPPRSLRPPSLHCPSSPFRQNGRERDERPGWDRRDGPCLL